MNRRQFSQLLLGLPIMNLPVLPWLTRQVQAAPNLTTTSADNTVAPQLARPFQLLTSASRNRQGEYALQLINADGQFHSHLLPARAHQVIAHPTQPWVAAFARRPGLYVDIVRQHDGQLQQRLTSEDGYHFYGHGVFSLDGRLLFTSENHIDSGAGSIAVRDLQAHGQVIRRFSSQGIGPHQLALMPDGETLVVANGGIRTHPDQGRKKLNLDSMSPSLVYLSSEDGEMLEEQKLAAQWHQLSIRHLAVNAEGQVAIAMQYQGAAFEEVPLVASHRQGEALQPLWAPIAVNRAMKQYCGSVSFEASGRYALISSPRGNLLTLWDMQEQVFVRSLQCRDGCGVASLGPKNFMVSNGLGALFSYRVGDDSLVELPLPDPLQVAWDNHLTVLG